MARLETRVAQVAAALLAERRSVRPVDVLVGLGWLAQPNVDRWAQRRAPVLDRCLAVDSDHAMAAFAALRDWAEDCGLTPSEAEYQDLRFTADADPDADRAWRTHWAPTGEPASAIERPPTRPKRMTVVALPNAVDCISCGNTSDFLLKGNAGALCLDCVDLRHLEFLPSGDAALTRRAVRSSRRSAVVMCWSARRNRYERQGILAEPAAIEKAALACLSDEGVRDRRREREQSRRADQDVHFREEFAAAIREQFPGCPVERAGAIALHAAARGSGRVGRTAAGRALDPDAVRLAVVASVRHVDTDYDDLLMSGTDRESARVRVRQRVEDIVSAWRDGVASLDE